MVDSSILDQALGITKARLNQLTFSGDGMPDQQMKIPEANATVVENVTIDKIIADLTTD